MCPFDEPSAFHHLFVFLSRYAYIRGKRLYILINYRGTCAVITCSIVAGLLLVHGLHDFIPENDCKLDNAHLAITIQMSTIPSKI